MIEFDAPFGDVTKKVRISEPFGTGATQYFLTIDGYHYGSLVKLDGKWVLHSNTNLLTTDDIQTLGDIIDKHLG